MDFDFFSPTKPSRHPWATTEDLLRSAGYDVPDQVRGALGRPSQLRLAAREWSAHVLPRAVPGTAQPSRNMLQRVVFDDLARAVKADHIADPAERGDVRDRIVVAHDPLPAVKASLSTPSRRLTSSR